VSQETRLSALAIPAHRAISGSNNASILHASSEAV